MSSATIVEESVQTPLSAQLRDGSRSEHSAAENAGFVTELLGGRISPAGYAEYLRRLRTVYVALEDSVFARRNDPLVAAVYDAALERRAALEADLDHWAPGESYDTDSPAARAYADRIAAADWGGALVAHHYTRYLGDLSGGQAIGKILTRAFSLDGPGVSFYEFPEIAKPKLYKDAYRANLDSLDVSEGERRRMVDEVRVAFGLNQALFDELGANLADYLR